MCYHMIMIKDLENERKDWANKPVNVLLLYLWDIEDWLFGQDDATYQEEIERVEEIYQELKELIREKEGDVI